MFLLRSMTVQKKLQQSPDYSRAVDGTIDHLTIQFHSQLCKFFFSTQGIPITTGGK